MNPLNHIDSSVTKSKAQHSIIKSIIRTRIWIYDPLKHEWYLHWLTQTDVEFSSTNQKSGIFTYLDYVPMKYKNTKSLSWAVIERTWVRKLAIFASSKQSKTLTFLSPTTLWCSFHLPEKSSYPFSIILGPVSHKFWPIPRNL